MRELNQYEMADVSGAGFITSFAEFLGAGLGTIWDAAFGTGTQIADVTGAFGRGLGMVMEATVNIVADWGLSIFK